MQTNSLPYSAIIKSPIGALGFNIIADKLINLDFLPNERIQLIKPQTPFAKEIVKQLNHYFKDSTFKFDLPITLQGTEFQIRVWQTMQELLPGQTVSYGILARLLETGARAIGNACRRNPIPIIVPCHRIVGANGMGGFNGSCQGQPLSIKAWLLQHESYNFLQKE